MFLPSVLRRTGLMSAGPERPVWTFAVLLFGIALLALTTTSSFSGKMMAQTSVAQAKPAPAGPGTWGIKDFLCLQYFEELFTIEKLDVWFFSIIGSIVVGLSGIFPLLVIPVEARATLKTEAGCQKLKKLLSFAIGGLLGDVFLHLLPEAWAYTCRLDTSHRHYHMQGLWVIAGLLSFLILEKMFPDAENDLEDRREKTTCSTTHSVSSTQINGSCSNNNSDIKPKSDINIYSQPEKIKTSGYLNLLANCIDNFTHGLAVAGSFLVSRKVGFLTTLAILLHEIPHEVGDFAILLRAGFDHWNAARMQLSTSLGGVLGACFALCSQSQHGAENATGWILPFTSGGFLYIALVNVVPDLIEETNPRNSFMQVLLLLSGIAVMAFLSVIMD